MSPSSSSLLSWPFHHHHGRCYHEQVSWFLLLASLLATLLLLYCTIHTFFFHRSAGAAVTTFRLQLDLLQARFRRLERRERDSWESWQAFSSNLDNLADSVLNEKWLTGINWEEDEGGRARARTTTTVKMGKEGLGWSASRRRRPDHIFQSFDAGFTATTITHDERPSTSISTKSRIILG